MRCFGSGATLNEDSCPVRTTCCCVVFKDYDVYKSMSIDGQCPNPICPTRRGRIAKEQTNESISALGVDQSQPHDDHHSDEKLSSGVGVAQVPLVQCSDNGGPLPVASDHSSSSGASLSGEGPAAPSVACFSPQGSGRDRPSRNNSHLHLGPHAAANMSAASANSNLRSISSCSGSLQCNEPGWKWFTEIRSRHQAEADLEAGITPKTGEGEIPFDWDKRIDQVWINIIYELEAERCGCLPKNLALRATKRTDVCSRSARSLRTRVRTHPDRESLVVMRDA